MAISWGIIGPGSIANNFADGLAQSTQGRLVAIAGRDASRREAFGTKYKIDPAKRYANHADLLADKSVDAIYVSTPHPWHAELAIAALRAGKHVLCEKPAGMNSAEVIAIAEVAAQEDRLFMEAFMYRCHPQIARVLEIIKQGEIGEVRHVRSQFGFNAPYQKGSRLYEPEIGGGAILDVGVYPVSLSRLIAGAAEGKPFANPAKVQGTGLLAETGVDSVAYGLLTFASGFIAEIAVAIARDMDNRAIITGANGQIVINDPWVPGRNAGPSDATIIVTSDGKTRTEVLRDPRMLFAFEAEEVSRAIAAGERQGTSPAPSHGDSIGNAETLDKWLRELNSASIYERPSLNKPLAGTLPKGLPKMTKRQLHGVATPISQLMICSNNRRTLAEGAMVWDAWLEAGGNAFDTGFVFGDGLYERVLGKWIALRNVAKDVVVLVKGGHTPYCLPDAIEYQLDASLERLGFDRAQIYALHRDNLDVPVGEFIDVLNRLRSRGKISTFGASNWTAARLAEANAYAEKRGLEPFRFLKNNLSLAEMLKPVWPGNMSSNNPETLSLLRQGGLAHLSWNPEARGYFLPEALRQHPPRDTGSEPEVCFGGPRNAERLKRAAIIAAEQGKTPDDVALAWVLGQPFPSFAITTPQSPGEVAQLLPALDVDLSDKDLAWLNLETDHR
jgi:predicted dehydrogenase/aryl-alcohol dehydrogenase-like predicted oxidoreductase